MVHDRVRANEPAAEVLDEAEVAKRPTDEAEAVLSGGNQMVARLLAADADTTTGGTGDDLAGRIRAQLGGGVGLPNSVRGQMEAGLGQRLGDVRIHTDATAARLSSELDARAFTTGNDVFFASGAYNPSSPEGYSTLAHELTHTLQQASGPVAGTEVSPGLSVSDPHDHDEQHARESAQNVMAQRATGSVSAAPAGHDDHDHLSVQRHSSWEHTMMGNMDPKELGKAAVPGEDRAHLLGELWRQMEFFKDNPERQDAPAQFPYVRWIQLAGSKMWISNGEMNALTDYLPNPEVIDTMAAKDLIPVLQKMRQGNITAAVAAGATAPGGAAKSHEMKGAAHSDMEKISAAAGEVKAIDGATAHLGTERYQGLLTRNACHFAPFSWHRWAAYHNDAIAEAEEHHKVAKTPAPLNVYADTETHARQAILKNGYGDHFLQDSFAAGHLINKTLVMQWWVDYLNQKKAERHSLKTILFGSATDQFGLPGQVDDDVLNRMGSQRQSGVAGRELYNAPDEKDSALWNQAGATGVTDPQSAQERLDRDRRVSGSGVTGANDAEREANYQAYLRLLNNSQAQLAAGSVHDHFNSIGLRVVSGDGTEMTVGGDDTYLKQSSVTGAEAAATAAKMSRQAVDETMTTGTSSITFDQIFAKVPAQVVVDGVPHPLADWQDDVLKNICMTQLFPKFYHGYLALVSGAAGEMVDGGMSKDSH